MIPEIWVLRGLEGGILVVGAIIAIQSFRAYRRTRSPALALLGLGFVLISVAAAVAGVLYELFSQDLLTAWVAFSTFDLAGFLVILYSILQVRPAPSEPSG
ncbi:MAG: hypothetical protein AAFA34_04645 [Thermoplasmata archaeon]|jgi:hypothetical protein